MKRLTRWNYNITPPPPPPLRPPPSRLHAAASDGRTDKRSSRFPDQLRVEESVRSRSSAFLSMERARSRTTKCDRRTSTLGPPLNAFGSDSIDPDSAPVVLRHEKWLPILDGGSLGPILKDFVTSHLE